MEVTVLPTTSGGGGWGGPGRGRGPGWLPRWLRRWLAGPLRGWRGPAVGVLALVTVVAMVLGLLGRLPGQAAAVASTGPPAGASSGSSGAAGSPSAAPLPSPAGAVLPGTSATAPLPTAAGLAAALGPLLHDAALGPHVGAVVVDLATGASAYGSNASSGFAPASTTKLLTAAAALATLGPAYRIATNVVAGKAPGQIVLVGGGDPTLATAPPPGFLPPPASLPQLAAATAAALKARGTRSVRLAYDTSLYSGPRLAPTWPAGYVAAGVVSPVTALMVDEGRVGLIAEGSAPRVPDPALGAANAFVRQLARQGVTVVGAPTRTVASRSATVLATVRSPALSDLLGWMLTTSDNDLAEALARQTAIAARQPADFAGGVDAVLGAIAGLGIPADTARVYDGSGLSPQTRVAPGVLGRVLSTSADADHAALRPLLTGLAVAGFTGSLEPPRFDGPTTVRAAGLVRAKTGTLTGVAALAGTVDDADGRVLGFVFVADEVPAAGALAARDALDRLAATVAGCGCR